MCSNTAKFTASDPATKEAPFGWVQENCTPKLYPSRKGEYMKDVISEMERLNVTAVVFGDPDMVQKWKAAAPKRVIPGTGFSRAITLSDRVPIEELRKDFTEGGFKVMCEIGLQYENLSPSDPSVDTYFALADQLDIPVAIHMGTSGSGRAYITMPNFRGSKGDPLLLEDLLVLVPRPISRYKPPPRTFGAFVLDQFHWRPLMLVAFFMLLISAWVGCAASDQLRQGIRTQENQ